MVTLYFQTSVLVVDVTVGGGGGASGMGFYRNKQVRKRNILEVWD
jgi:hypothetical protein